MRKILSMLVAVAVLGMALVSCSKKQAGSSASSEEKKGSGGIGVVADEMFVDHLNKRWLGCLDACGDGLIDGFEESVEKSGWEFGVFAFFLNVMLQSRKALRCLGRRPSVQMTLPCCGGWPDEGW